MSLNTRNPAIKRIYADVAELRNHKSSRYFAEPLEASFYTLTKSRISNMPFGGVG